MRHNQNRRSRGRSRKGPNPLTRSYESNGPDVKVRGTASHVAEKYMSLARDAQASGDVVAAENYLQHAEHYNRIVMAAQAQFQQSQPQFRDEGDEGYDDDRPMNGRGRDRFDYNGDGRDDDGDDMGESEPERSFRPMRQEGRQEQGDRPRGPRSDRPDRFEQRRERPDYRDRERPQRFRDDEPAEAESPAPAAEDAAQPVVEEAAPPPAPRRRRRPARTENPSTDADESTSDGAAALAAFPD
jgi:hypothetical protein